MIEREIWRGTRAFQEQAAAWNLLWEQTRSPVALHRSEPLVHWLSAFQGNAEFVVIALRTQGHLVLGLPLLIRRNSWGQRTAITLANEWAAQACVLCHANLPGPEVVAQIRAACAELKIFQLRLDWLPLEWTGPKFLLSAWQQSAELAWIKPRHQVSQIELAGDWDQFRSHWSKNRRKKIQQNERQLQALGQVEFQAWDEIPEHQSEALFEQAVAIEQASWKGAVNGALIQHPSALDYYRQWFCELSRCGLARLYFLVLDGRPIAFDLGYLVQGVYSSVKISYREEYRDVRPGEWLNVRVLEHFHRTQSARCVDCIGPVTEATERWQSSTYTIGRATLATPLLFSGVTVSAFQTLSQWMRR